VSAGDFDPSDYERPRGVRGVLRLEHATISLLLTRSSSGAWRASALLCSEGDGWAARNVPITVTGPTPRECWAALNAELAARLEVLR